MRLDIGWMDLLWAILSAMTPGRRQQVQQAIEQQWSNGKIDALVSLSVRSAFDVYLQSLKLPAQSEVLFSAVTIPSMPDIVRRHGLVPIPVDIKGIDYRTDVDSLRRAITPRSKAIVIAHLFGARPDLSPVLRIAKEHCLFVVEDCAQAWYEWGWRGDDRADINLFSFGTIKTATASGGALCRVRDPMILSTMRQLQELQPVQASNELFSKLLTNLFLKATSAKWVYGLLWTMFQTMGRDFEQSMSNLTLGFPTGELLERIRRQPSIGLLRSILRRMNDYDSRRIQRRVQIAARIIGQLGLQSKYEPILDGRHCFWVFPLFVTQGPRLIDRLRKHGFDATQRGRLKVIEPPADRPGLDCPNANELLETTVFLPCYPELSDTAIDRMCQVIRQVDHENEILIR